MNRTSRFETLFAAAILTVLISIPARAERYGEVTVQVGSLANSIRTHGYQEYRVTLSNMSARNRHQVRLVLPERGYYGGTVSRTVTVEPSSTQTVSIFSSFTMGGNGLGVEVDGEPQRDVISINLNGYSYEIRPSVLISQGAAAQGFSTKAAGVLKNPDGKETFIGARSEAPSTDWSVNWLGYSSFDGVVATADELRAMPEPALSALTRYVECGGTLLVLNAWEPPEPWRAEGRSMNGLIEYFAGFGLFLVLAEPSSGLTEPVLRLLKEEWTKSRAPWSSPTASFDFANTSFPVIENASIPVRGLLLIMLLFVILIGPVNLIVLTKKKKRIWLLFTVPVISLATCLAVSGYSLFSEGWSGRARYLSFTVLDERSHRASSIGLNAFYSPLTPGDGLRYGTETEVTGRDFSAGYSNDGSTHTIDWTDGQHLDSGWVTARTPAQFMIRRSETRRERVTMSRTADGSVSMINGLGVRIRTLWVADERGSVYTGSDIAPGAAATLTFNNTPRPPAPGNGLRSKLGDAWTGLVEPASHLALLRPRTYIAELEGCPFLEEGLRGLRQKRSESVVYGIMRTGANED